MKKKLKTIEENSNAWMITFSDLLTLLLTFFVLLLSMSTMDNQKIKRTLSFFLSAAGAMETGEKGGVGRVYVVTPRMQVAGGRLDAESKASSKEMKLGVEIGLAGELSLLMIPIMDIAEEAMADVRPKEKPLLELEELLILKGIDVDLQAGKTVVRVSSRLLFASGAAEIHIEGLDLLLWLADTLRDSPYLLEVEGHTDSSPISTIRFSSNWELSIERAVNVVRFLEETGRIPGARLSAAGYADLRPLFSNDTAEGRVKNRRVEIILKTGA